MTIHTHNDFHLGDNLVVLNFLRRLAFDYPKHEFVHAANLCHIPQLADVVKDVPNIRIVDIEARDKNSLDLWKNAGAGTPQGGFWEGHPLKEDFVWFHVAWFSHVTQIMGLDNPIKRASSLLFNFPALVDSEHILRDQRFDFLFINSRPCSGQLPAYDSIDYFDGLITKLVAAGHNVVCTQPTEVEGVTCTKDVGLTVAQIGNISIHTPYIVGVATGPMWPTFNVWNQASVKLRLILLEGENLNIDPEAVQVTNIQRATEVLRGRGLLG